MDATHVSQDGLVSQHSGDDGDVWLSPITATDVIKSFLEGSGIVYLQTSSPGLALARILEMMGGFYGCEVFQNEAIRQTLEEMAKGEPQTVHSVEISIIQTLKHYTIYEKPASQKEKGRRASQLLSSAIDAKLFKVGLVFQCSRCQRRNWYATIEFTDGYRCKSCFASESTPHIHEHEWYVASDGLFRSANKLDGNITVLLALNFFYHVLDHDLRYAPSFNYKIDQNQNEMDFGIISTEMFREVETIFGESKSGSSLSDDERRKLKLFGKKTGAYICFCTLSDDFSDADKDYFRELFEDDVKIILLAKRLLEMNDFDLSKYKLAHNPGRSKTIPDWLMRLSIINFLGAEFATKHYIWL
jgi:hypothetical protein